MTNWSNRGMYINRDISSRVTRTATTKINLLDRPSNNMPLYCLTVCLHIKPERRSDFLQCISANQFYTLTSEPDAITYVYGEDTSISNTWHFFEQYINKAGFDAHSQTQHFAKWEEFVSTDPFTADPQVNFFIEDSSPTAIAHGTTTDIIRDALLAYSGNGYHATLKLYCKTVQMVIQPEKRTIFLNALRTYQHGALTTTTDDKPNANNALVTCLFGEDVEQTNVFYMFEAFTDGEQQEGLEEQAEYYKQWTQFKVMEKPFLIPPKIEYYEIQLPYGVMN